MNQVRVNLTQSDQRPGASLAEGSELAQKLRPVPLDRSAGILLREPQIQGPPAVSLGESAGARAEPMDEPGNRPKGINLQDFAGNLPESFGRHRNILATSPPPGNPRFITNGGGELRSELPASGSAQEPQRV